MSELDFEPIKDSKSNFNKVLVRLKKIKIPDLPNDIYKKKASEKFWESILYDIENYDKHIHNKTPFKQTCYETCSDTCVRKFDRAFWTYAEVGFQKRSFVSIYKFPSKLISLLLVIISGIFKIIRANQDGKASFYGNILYSLNQVLTFSILMADEEYVMSIPKLGGFLVSIFILYGIFSNVGENDIGL
tara:strand:- start:1185 stop:1748 length:564 start_codon:yes stop_codon:yes gene_type:complete